jgi:hypothetical protein
MANDKATDLGGKGHSALRLRGGGGGGLATLRLRGGANEEMRCIQLNVNRSSTVHDLLQRMGEETDADILLVCEPNRKRIDGSDWYVDRLQDAAIKALGRETIVDRYGSGEGHVWIETGPYRFISAYVSPNSGWGAYERRLEEVGVCVRSSRRQVLLAGDFNAKSPLWGSKREDQRGAALADLLAQCDLTVLNQGNQPTFVGVGGSSTIGMTCASAGLAQRVVEWRVEEQETTSDHCPITYRLQGKEVAGTQRKASAGWT